ncbi:cobalt-precorrin-6A reductase [Rhizobiales bacterium]|uniref:cobalt-precorrin-6A reductase n=1 Tax=Hongsoonwoonella zoysiae TaxID=2821844 RepID=UPI001560C5B6|nr:cobalt-precorrin-6A reductase [Hongsoonwoonella zoysiae]NRG16361.1 cobalt-precorrin-6A reductase [Hongsoonwoonella zoysiae]
MPEFRILLLGGTGEARELAARLAGDARLHVIVSLAGVTSNPETYPVETRIGGFGGADGLADYLKKHRISAVIDATHPFARSISTNAVAAAGERKIPIVRLVRPAWQPEPGDNWTPARDVEHAVELVPDGARVFLAIGRKEVSRFANRHRIWCLMRMIEAPDEQTRLPPGELLLARPSHFVDDEKALMERHRITHLVAKNSGGPAGYAKIQAACVLHLPVVMIRRPSLPAIAEVESVDGVLAWLDDIFTVPETG